MYDQASETRRELYEKEKETTEAQGEIMQLKRALKEADDQCLLLFGEVQKAWKLASSLQADLTSHESYIDKLQVYYAVFDFSVGQKDPVDIVMHYGAYILEASSR